MYIFNQTHDEITNVDTITHINCDGNVICAYTIGNIRRVLGEYDRPEIVLQRLVGNIKAGWNVIYMPEIG